MGIRAKQIQTGTFDGTTAGRAPFGANLFDSTLVASAFAAGAIPDTKLTESYLLANGTRALTGNLDLGTNRIVNVGDAIGANDVVNRGQLDAAISGLTWQSPVYVKELVGSAAASAIEALTPTTGDAYVVSAADGAGDLATATVGDIWEYDGATWNLIIAGVGGFVADGVRAIVSTQTALNGTLGLTDGVDDGKIAQWDGTSLTPSDLYTPTDQWAVLVTDQDSDGDSIFANNGYTFMGVVPTGTWTQFTGAGQINAGAGLTKTGNTLNAGDVNRGVQVNADDLQVDASEIAGNALAQRAGGGNEHILDVNPAGLIDGGAAEIDADLLAVSQVPANYTRSTAGEATALDQLAAHLQGIDDALGAAGATETQELVTSENITGTDTALSDTLDNTPVSAASVKLFLNGVLLRQGAGQDYSISGTTITWLAATGTAPDLDTTDELLAVYEFNA